MVVIAFLASMALVDTVAGAFSMELGLRWTSPVAAAFLLLGGVGLLRRNRWWHRALAVGLLVMWCYLSIRLFHWFIRRIPWLHGPAIDLPFDIYGQPTDLPMAVPSVMCLVIWAFLAAVLALLLTRSVRSFVYRG